ncbi:MAG: hypothetical protein KME04_15820 [Pleurocapsa minor GSE-CHR-MK-17-07R]|jgi:hypothetical protein|nr:hypothetical protein [Pleurocapsa minor GSE-CHR-MK 17-07R]
MPFNLTDVLSGQQESRWLDDLDFDDLDGVRRDDAALRASDGPKLAAFLAMRHHDEVAAFTRQFLLMAVPAVFRSEAGGWTLAACPEASTYLRLLVGGQTAMQVTYFDEEDLPIFEIYLPRALMSRGLDMPLKREELDLSLELEGEDEPIECCVQPAGSKTDPELMLISAGFGSEATALAQLLLPELRAHHVNLMRRPRPAGLAAPHNWLLVDHVLSEANP